MDKLRKFDNLTPDQRSEVSFLVGVHKSVARALAQLTDVLDKNRNWQLYLDLPTPPNNTAALLRDAELRLSHRIQILTGLTPARLETLISSRVEKSQGKIT